MFCFIFHWILCPLQYLSYTYHSKTRLDLWPGNCWCSEDPCRKLVEPASNFWTCNYQQGASNRMRISFAVAASLPKTLLRQEGVWPVVLAMRQLPGGSGGYRDSSGFALLPGERPTRFYSSDSYRLHPAGKLNPTSGGKGKSLFGNFRFRKFRVLHNSISAMGFNCFLCSLA
jgi:hypothetical protein